MTEHMLSMRHCGIDPDHNTAQIRLHLLRTTCQSFKAVWEEDRLQIGCHSQRTQPVLGRNNNGTTAAGLAGPFGEIEPAHGI
ncbi:hypothetical protein [Paraliomyxa miuraensis]|uniref:hypothetical protein n=1 Tax=Paraliomyxa miuraensis TaxID=376150 RepID=UPI002259F094|nr:hypothetical protein [Paraliomyxa miuraensis]MCX4239494.1 hypothetical protein [Paraliomyxa miuraensis]